MDKFSDVIIKAVNKVKNAVVKIDIQGKRSEKDERERGMGSGSGFFFSSDGMIFTNNHVINGASKIQVTYLDGQSHEAHVVGQDPHTDLAVIKSSGPGHSVTELGDSDTLEIGQFLIAIGNPIGYQHSVTHGILSATSRSLRTNTGGSIENVLQTDAPLNPGNSGGPLIDTEGTVVGVSTAIIRGMQGLSFAIDINTAKEVAQHLIRDGKVVKAYLGVQIQPLQINERVRNFHALENKSGLIIVSVQQGSPANKAGLMEGDILLAFNAKTVENSSTLFRGLTAESVGKLGELRFLRNGQLKTVSVVPELIKAA